MRTFLVTDLCESMKSEDKKKGREGIGGFSFLLRRATLVAWNWTRLIVDL